jgi:hypothetical protein
VSISLIRSRRTHCAVHIKNCHSMWAKIFEKYYQVSCGKGLSQSVASVTYRIKGDIQIMNYTFRKRELFVQLD